MTLDFLPLKTNAHIVEGNALRMDWNEVIPKEKLSYIMGNPPFVGGKMMSASQKEDMLYIFGKKWKNLGNMDYVSCWYKKAFDYIQNTRIEAALVSTNSVSQGQAVASLLGLLLKQGLIINFAWPSFIWDSEASVKAHVHCVIIGFSFVPRPVKYIYSASNAAIVANNINGFLIDAENVIIDNRTRPISDVPLMDFGNMPNDGGNLILTEQEKQETLAVEPNLSQYIRPFIGAIEFINKKYGIKHFEFIDECISPAYLQKLSEEILSRHLDIAWFNNARLEEAFTQEVLSSAHKAGLKMLLWGFESGSKRIMELINKGIDIDNRIEIMIGNRLPSSISD